MRGAEVESALAAACTGAIWYLDVSAKCLRMADIDIGRAWFEAALGATCHLSNNFYLYGELATSKGTEVDNPFQWNVGARLSF